jgi:hypothetical protein
MDSMRISGVGLATLLVAVAPASADVYRQHVSGFGVITTFHTISDDGCVETDGELAAVHTGEGDFGYLTALRTDYCAVDGPVDWAFAWIEPVTFQANLTSATLSGSFAMTPYAGPPGGDATITFSLSFAGSGPISTTNSRFISSSPDDITLSFSSTRQRAATASGSLSFGGDAGSVTSAQLVGGTSGDLVVIH